jgi:hypothetical protein
MVSLTLLLRCSILDQYGDTTVIERDDGWFRDSTTVTETDRYGDTTVTEEDSWF